VRENLTAEEEIQVVDDVDIGIREYLLEITKKKQNKKKKIRVLSLFNQICTYYKRVQFVCL